MEEEDVEAIVQKEKMDVLDEIKTIKVLAKRLREIGLDVILERSRQKQPLVSTAEPSQPAVTTTIMPAPTELLKKLQCMTL
jgi:hypothetical protein